MLCCIHLITVPQDCICSNAIPSNEFYMTAIGCGQYSRQLSLRNTKNPQTPPLWDHPSESSEYVYIPQREYSKIRVAGGFKKLGGGDHTIRAPPTKVYSIGKKLPSEPLPQQGDSMRKCIRVR